MSTIENNSAIPRDLSSVRAWMESSKYGEYEKRRNMINVPLAREKSTLKDGFNNARCTGKNVAHAQPILSHEEDEIQNSNFEHVPSKRPSDDPEEDDRFCSFSHSYGSFNRDIFNILDLLWVSCTLFIHIFTLFMYRKSSCTFICQVAPLTSSCQFSTFDQCSLLPQASLSFF